MSARDVLCQAGWLLAAHLSFAGGGQGKGRLAEGVNHSPDTWANDPTEACSNYESSIAVRTTDPQHRRHPPLHARQRSRTQPHRRLHLATRQPHQTRKIHATTTLGKPASDISLFHRPPHYGQVWGSAPSTRRPPSNHTAGPAKLSSVCGYGSGRHPKSFYRSSTPHQSAINRAIARVPSRSDSTDTHSSAP